MDEETFRTGRQPDGTPVVQHGAEPALVVGKVEALPADVVFDRNTNVAASMLEEMYRNLRSDYERNLSEHEARVAAMVAQHQNELATLQAHYEHRVSELLEANNRLVEDRRTLQRQIDVMAMPGVRAMVSASGVARQSFLVRLINDKAYAWASFDRAGLEDLQRQIGEVLAGAPWAGPQQPQQQEGELRS